MHCQSFDVQEFVQIGFWGIVIKSIIVIIIIVVIITIISLHPLWLIL